MKTVLLFSSVFYLLGLKMGNTIEILKKIIVPVKSIISAPAEQPAKTGKNYYFNPKATSVKKEMDKKENPKSSPVSDQKSAENIVQKSGGSIIQKLPQ
jgi:hypothetical protein